MAFLLFDVKYQATIELPQSAVADLIARIDQDYPPYVKQLPCIYDVHNRKCYNGSTECLEYLQRYHDLDVDSIHGAPQPSPRYKHVIEDVPPEVQQEIQQEVQQEAQQEVQQEAQQEAQQEGQPEVQHEGQPEVPSTSPTSPEEELLGVIETASNDTPAQQPKKKQTRRRKTLAT